MSKKIMFIVLSITTFWVALVQSSPTQEALKTLKEKYEEHQLPITIYYITTEKYKEDIGDPNSPSTREQLEQIVTQLAVTEIAYRTNPDLLKMWDENMNGKSDDDKLAFLKEQAHLQ